MIPIRTRGNASTSRELKMREQDNRMTGIGDGNEEVLYIHRTPTLDRCLDELRRKGGVPSQVAQKADELIRLITRTKDECLREQFRFTRNGEYRMKYCRKYDLGCGYRLVLLQKGRHLVLLYAGTHDDCFRWIEHNKKMDYQIDDTTYSMPVRYNPRADASVSGSGLKREPPDDKYEADLMSRINDRILRKVFSGLLKQ